MTAEHINTKILNSIEEGDLKTFKSLVQDDDELRNGPNGFDSWLHVACDVGQLPIVRYLVENGADVNLRSDTFDTGPIKEAACEGHTDIVRYLLGSGAKMEVETPDRNPLFGAICDGYVEVVRVLLDAGIDPHVTYRSQAGPLKNALSFAKEMGYPEVIQVLHQAGCRMPETGSPESTAPKLDNHSSVAVRKAIVEAIRVACKEMAETYGDDQLFGFALCTDDDVGTLFSAACTRSWVNERKPDYAGIGYIYTEWNQDSGQSNFDSISDVMAAQASSENPSTASKRFETLVLALQDCRDLGLFDPDTLLCCGSTDPSIELETLTMRAVDRLNSASNADAFAKHLGYDEYRENR